MNKELTDRLRAHLMKEFNGYNSLRFVRTGLKKQMGHSIRICCLSSKAHEIEVYMRNVFGLPKCKASPYIDIFGTNLRDYTKLFWDDLAQEELDCIDTLLRMRG